MTLLWWNAVPAPTITVPVATILMSATVPALAEQSVRVGGQPMFPSKTIVGNAVNSADHTTLVAAVKAAGLVDTLEGKGPFTVFAPTNAAFAKLPAGTVDTLLKPSVIGKDPFDVEVIWEQLYNKVKDYGLTEDRVRAAFER